MEDQTPNVLLTLYKRKGKTYVPAQLHEEANTVMGFTAGDTLYYVSSTFTRLSIHGDFLTHQLRLVFAVLFALLSLGSFGLFLFFFTSEPLSINPMNYWLGGSAVPAYWWLALLFGAYALYFVLQTKRVTEPLPHIAADKLGATGNILHSVDILTSCSTSLTDAINKAVILADEHGDNQVSVWHLLSATLEDYQVQLACIRIGVNPFSISKRLQTFFEKKKNTLEPVFSNDAYQALANAYLHASSVGASSVDCLYLFREIIGLSEQMQDYLEKLDFDQDQFALVMEWKSIQDKLRADHETFRLYASLRSKHGIDRAMTAVSTPYLDSFSNDLTRSAKYGALDVCVARDEELTQLYRSFESGKQGVLLVGESGTGKKTIVYGLAQEILLQHTPKVLEDKRLIELSVSHLLAGTNVRGAQERLIGIMNEVAKAGNIILFIPNIDDLFDTTGEGFDVSETLAEFMQARQCFVVATASNEGYEKVIANTGLANLFSSIRIAEMNADQTRKVVESKIGYIEYKEHVLFTLEAIQSAIALSARFLKDKAMPGNALELIAEVATYKRTQAGTDKMVTKEDVASIITKKTGVATTAVSNDESSKLMTLEKAMHERVIGQDDAVSQVANALRRSRVQIQSKHRPIATYLFLGPTGVGKTELTKTIADVYFGSEERMIRIDMSEYQDKSSIYRLIGQPGEKGTGILTEAVRKTPFALILLDELEKASKDVLNIFLQVFDDGRLTDSIGRTVDFTNTIIIATSNAGTPYVTSEIQKGTDYAEIKKHLIHEELSGWFTPEFLNRFDDITLFKSLSKEDIKQIARLMLGRIEKELAGRGISMRIEDSALEYLASIGYDPQFGARPMRRAIQDTVENKLAELLLTDSVKKHDTVIIHDKSITVEES